MKNRKETGSHIHIDAHEFAKIAEGFFREKFQRNVTIHTQVTMHQQNDISEDQEVVDTWFDIQVSICPNQTDVIEE